MDTLIRLAIDLVAISVLTFAVYYPRHRRRDLLVAFLGVNVGVFAVAAVLGSATVTMGLGLGLFGVLSIIRLRSYEISQREIVYYFAALALGLVTGLPGSDIWLVAGLIALIVVVMWAGDHAGVLRGARQQVVVLDRALAADEDVRARLEEVLGGTVMAFTVQKLDLVDDTTVVDVRYRVPRDGAAAPALPEPEFAR